MGGVLNDSLDNVRNPIPTKLAEFVAHGGACRLTRLVENRFFDLGYTISKNKISQITLLVGSLKLSGWLGNILSYLKKIQLPVYPDNIFFPIRKNKKFPKIHFYQELWVFEDIVIASFGVRIGSLWRCLTQNWVPYPNPPLHFDYRPEDKF